MDTTKLKHLVEQLSAQPAPQLIPIATFFDGNDDLGSIGCNLMDHPGIDAFREAFARIARRRDVQAIYARISEVDPDDDCWPFTDTVFVVGTLHADELAAELSGLEPDEVGSAKDFGIPDALARKYTAPILVAWWD